MPPPITRALFWPSGSAVAHWKEIKRLLQIPEYLQYIQTLQTRTGCSCMQQCSIYKLIGRTKMKQEKKLITSITTLAYCKTSSSLGAPLYSAQFPSSDAKPRSPTCFYIIVYKLSLHATNTEINYEYGFKIRETHCISIDDTSTSPCNHCPNSALWVQHCEFQRCTCLEKINKHSNQLLTSHHNYKQQYYCIHQ